MTEKHRANPKGAEVQTGCAIASVRARLDVAIGTALAAPWPHDAMTTADARRKATRTIRLMDLSPG
jgi:hypothetical protein